MHARWRACDVFKIPVLWALTHERSMMDLIPPVTITSKRKIKIKIRDVTGAAGMRSAGKCVTIQGCKQTD
jgi:hypothetical protein